MFSIGLQSSDVGDDESDLFRSGVHMLVRPEEPEHHSRCVFVQKMLKCNKLPLFHMSRRMVLVNDACNGCKDTNIIHYYYKVDVELFLK